MASIRHLVLAFLFIAGAALGIVSSHTAIFDGASAVSVHIHLAGDGNPTPPNI